MSYSQTADDSCLSFCLIRPSPRPFTSAALSASRLVTYERGPG